jgi:hypothetical protein
MDGCVLCLCMFVCVCVYVCVFNWEVLEHLTWWGLGQCRSL